MALNLAAPGLIKDLIDAVSNCQTKADVLRELGLQVRPGNYDTLNRHLNRLMLSTKHFKGSAHGKAGMPKKPLVEYLVRNSALNRGSLKNRLIKEQLIENKCALCPVKDSWNGKPIVLVLDHINGVCTDNRLCNLRLLCPNCNSQQATFCRKKV